MQGKGKRKVDDLQDSNSDEKGSLYITWTSSEKDDVASKTSIKKPTLEPSPKRHKSKARTKALHNSPLQTSERI